MCMTLYKLYHSKQIPPSDLFIKYIVLQSGEGNGNPLQYSCLENPRDRGAWWAAVYGVAQSWTRLKQLRSSSSIHPLFWLKIKRQLYQVLLMIQNNCEI